MRIGKRMPTRCRINFRTAWRVHSADGIPNSCGLRVSILASGSWDGEVWLWNCAGGQSLKTILAAPGLKPASNVQASAK